MGFLREHGNRSVYDGTECDYRDYDDMGGIRHKRHTAATAVVIEKADRRNAMPRRPRHQPLFPGFDDPVNPEYVVAPFEDGTAAQSDWHTEPISTGGIRNRKYGLGRP